MSTIKVNEIQSIDGTVTHNVKDLGGLGVNQTWQNVTSQRALDTDYVNDTGRSIQISIRDSSDAGYLAIRIDGLAITSTPYTSAGSVACIIPAGSTYSVSDNGGALLYWFELR